MPVVAQSCVLLPSHIVGLPVILQTGAGLTITETLQLLVQPAPLVMVTEYVPAVVAVKHCVLAPVLHT